MFDEPKGLIDRSMRPRVLPCRTLLVAPDPSGVPTTLITVCVPYDVASARSWAAHGAFLGWAERQHGSVEKAVRVLVEGRQRA